MAGAYSSYVTRAIWKLGFILERVYPVGGIPVTSQSLLTFPLKGRRRTDAKQAQNRKKTYAKVLLPPLFKGASALRRNRNPADCKEEKEHAEEACSGRAVGCPAEAAQR